jgi:parvulin-like peptidyl-prolyl isomerase
VASVNGVAIDRTEFLDQLSQLMKLQNGDANATAEQRSSLLTQRIIASLVADEVTRLHLAIAPADLEKARGEVGEIPEGISQAFFDYVVQVQAQQDVLVTRIGDVTQPWFSDSDINNFYESVKDAKYVNYCTHHILVNTEADANEIMGLLNNGGDFAQIASERSTDTQSSTQGGDLGCNPKGSFVPEFEDAVFAATTGDTIGPVKTQYGYHIIHVDKDYGVQLLDDNLRQTIANSFGSEQGWLAWKTYSSKIKVNKKYGSWSNTDASVIPPADPTVKK